MSGGVGFKGPRRFLFLSAALGICSFAPLGSSAEPSSSATPSPPASTADRAPASDCGPLTVGYRVAHFGGRTVALWYPTEAPASEHHYSSRFSGQVAFEAKASRACGAPVPLVLFSHGDLGCGLQSVAFTEELARHGYVVAAPDHADAVLRNAPRPLLSRESSELASYEFKLAGT
ncbi:MAG TPA: hypothetical protein VK437_07390 [Steroidobacteraceae bacterium]|nr:hypothetical protein [Steroidobacteraceae bacterium]